MTAMPSPSAVARRPFSRQAGWVAVLALSPLCYLASFYLVGKLPVYSRISTIDREQAIRLATDFAATRGLDVRGWSPSMGADKDKNVVIVLRHPHPAALEQVTGPSVVTVLFRSPQAGDWFRVQLTPQG